MSAFFSKVREKLGAPSLTILSGDSAVMTKAKTLVSVYYYVAPFAVFMFVTGGLLLKPNFDPIWPLAWTSYFHLPYPTVVNILTILVLVTTLAGMYLHRYRLVRLSVFFAFWQLHAFESSFGAYNHQWYMWVYSSFIFIFLPNIWSGSRIRPDDNRLFLLCIWTAQAFVMLLYTMAGLHKVYAAYFQYMVGEIHSFSILAFAYQIAEWLPKLQTPALFGPFIIDHPLIGWLPYVGLQLVQVFALWSMVRTGLQRLWTLIFIMFHIGTYLTMGISFQPLMLVVILLFADTPFAKKYASVKEFVYDLPVIGQLPAAYRFLRKSFVRSAVSTTY